MLFTNNLVGGDAMHIGIEFELFNTTLGTIISEGKGYQVVHINGEVDLDSREGVKVMNQAVAKEINRSASDIKVLGYKMI